MLKKIKKAVYAEVKKISRGKTATYKQIAKKVGVHPRTVASALRQNYNKNVSCHRVIMSSGKLGGYNRGVRRKRMLLKKEGAISQISL